jgi:hypothetical protein
MAGCRARKPLGRIRAAGPPGIGLRRERRLPIHFYCLDLLTFLQRFDDIRLDVWIRVEIDVRLL